MAKLCLNNKEIKSIFGLLGDKENDISFSVAWALSKCPFFLKEFIKVVLRLNVNPDDININLQHYEKRRGITDIELELPGSFFIIIEAKRGWHLPGRQQLSKYVRRKSLLRSRAPLKKLIVLSGCSKEYAAINLDPKSIGSIKIDPISWQEIAVMAKRSKSKSSHAEKRLLDDILIYLKEVIDMQRIDSNWVYVVAIGKVVPKKWRISYFDIVEKKRYYFHPIGGNGWPKEPPNYIALRYYGRLQSIHHIEGVEIITHMHRRIKEIPDQEWKPHFLYKLGKPFAPGNEVRVGKIYPNGRVWCMLDTLFTSKTISQARDISKKRWEGEEL